MNQLCTFIVLTASLFVGVAASLAQAPAAIDDAARFAPGIVRVIEPPPEPDETFSGPLPLQEFLANNPQIDWKAPDFPEGQPFFNSRSRTLIEKAKQVTLRREIHGFEFAFKPMRQIYVDIPQATGVMKRKLIWYMVFRVRYRGGDLRSKEVVDDFGNKTYPDIEAIAYKQRRCFPMLVLSNHAKGKEYIDRVLPTAREPIARREQIRSKLHNTVEIGTLNIPRTTDPDAPGVWGVATWEDVDPSTDFFSVYVHGLTNAFRTAQSNGEEKVLRKILQLNFYRPGDSVRQLADEIRFGVPAYEDPTEQSYILKQYGLTERLDYQWLFR
ncbi:hypothetical protein Poly24_20580 [Rosistilla carotiformis]|uniref:Uncharacterized protein n=1 Tax=Rosistilla carotiformis TaxID=2528017 RepID=A0A518JS22_9BACT|nr:hypothetical protein [Rosistilla carotiformis]QDV68349.1 hypothetical protein Poly24_20580 [Rosistilla carotiformis]